MVSPPRRIRRTPIKPVGLSPSISEISETQIWSDSRCWSRILSRRAEDVPNPFRFLAWWLAVTHTCATSVHQSEHRRRRIEPLPPFAYKVFTCHLDRVPATAASITLFHMADACTASLSNVEDRATKDAGPHDPSRSSWIDINGNPRGNSIDRSAWKTAMLGYPHRSFPLRCYFWKGLKRNRRFRGELDFGRNRWQVSKFKVSFK